MRGGTGHRAIAGRILTVATLSVAACAALAVPVLTPTAASATTAGCQSPVTPGQRFTAVPHEQQRFAPDRLAPLATGKGVVVAVIDSGVDDDHPQLRGRVDTGRDYLEGRSARKDCKGHGTGVAGIIAARPVDGVPFRGLAPDARVLPIRVTENTDDQQPRDDAEARSEISDFAEAITWAVEQGADVINLSVTLEIDDIDVRRSVERAVRKDVVVVAAVGNNAGQNKANPEPYPAAYPGVLGVGAVGRAGTRLSFSQHGTYVDVMAPGEQVITTAAGGGHQSPSGTSFATPFVTATAALVRQRFPDLSAEQVVARIIDTSDPAPGGRRSDEYGHGVVNPYRALTESVLPTGPARAAAPLPGEDPAAIALQHRRDRARDRALLVAAIGAGVTVIVVIVVLVVPAGRRRRWSPGSPWAADGPP